MQASINEIKRDNILGNWMRFSDEEEERRYTQYYLKQHEQIMYVVYFALWVVNSCLVWRILSENGFEEIALLPIALNQILVVWMFFCIRQGSNKYNQLSCAINMVFSLEVFFYQQRFENGGFEDYAQLCGFIIFGSHSFLMLSSQILYDSFGFIADFLLYTQVLGRNNRIIELLLLWVVILITVYSKLYHHRLSRFLYVSLQRQQEWLDVIDNLLPSAIISIQRLPKKQPAPKQVGNARTSFSHFPSLAGGGEQLVRSSSFANNHVETFVHPLDDWSLNLVNEQGKEVFGVNDMDSFIEFANNVLIDTKELSLEPSIIDHSHLDKNVNHPQSKIQMQHSQSQLDLKKNEISSMNLNHNASLQPSPVIYLNSQGNVPNPTTTLQGSTCQFSNKLSSKQIQIPVTLDHNANRKNKYEKNRGQIQSQNSMERSVTGSQKGQERHNPAGNHTQGAQELIKMQEKSNFVESNAHSEKSNLMGTDIFLSPQNQKISSALSMHADAIPCPQITLYKHLQQLFEGMGIGGAVMIQKFFVWKLNGKYVPPKKLQNIDSEETVIQKEKQAVPVQIKVCGFRGKHTRIILCVDDMSISEKVQLYQSQDKYKDLVLANAAHDLRQPLNTLNFTISEAMSILQKFEKLSLADLLSQYYPEKYQQWIKEGERKKENSVHEDLVYDSKLSRLGKNCTELQMAMELLGMADISGNSLKYLINDILDHAKLKEGKLQVRFKECSVGSILEFTKKMFHYAFKERGIKYRIINQADIDSDMICTDEQRLQQVLVNLLSNSIKFTSSNKYIILHITRVFKNVNNRQVSLLKIAVIDQGCGMSQEQLQQIFQPYVSFNHNNLNIEGIGLGLHICKSIIGLLGPYPKLYVKSKLNEGTKFFFYIYHQLRKGIPSLKAINPSTSSPKSIVRIYFYRKKQIF